MDIIDVGELALYLRDSAVEADDSASLIVELANGLVSSVLTDPLREPSPRVRTITLEVAARAYRNPDGYSSETVDDYTYRLPEEARRAGVYLTPTEATELRDADSPTPKVRMGWLA